MSRQSEVHVAQVPTLARSHMQGPMQAAGSRGERRGLNGGRGPLLSDPGPFLRLRRLQWRQAASWHNCSGVPMPRVILDHSQDVLSSA